MILLMILLIMVPTFLRKPGTGNGEYEGPRNRRN